MAGRSQNKSRWRIAGLNRAQLAHIRELTGYRGEDGLQLFEQAVWWWKPLKNVIGERAHAIEIPPATKRRFFPLSTFREMRAAEAGTGLEDLLGFWFDQELPARLDGARSAWPAYMIDLSTARLPEWERLHLAEVPAHTIDLRKNDAELLTNFRQRISELRAARREAAPWPLDDCIRRSSYLSDHTFAVIELIDRKKFSIGKPVTEGEWANVNKAVRQRGPYLFRR